MSRPTPFVEAAVVPRCLTDRSRSATSTRDEGATASRCRSGILWLLAAVALCSAASGMPPTGELVEGIACRADPSQTYTLYLPSSYSPQRQWPVLLVFDPRGRSVHAAQIFQEAAEAYGWVLLSSDNTRSDGPWEPNDRAMRAMWPEPFERWNADPRRVYAAGFSGGAIAALILVEATRGLAGVIGAGGRASEGVSITQTEYAHFGAAGLTDFNYDDMQRLDGFFAEHGNPHRLELFPGRHRWLPPQLATLAVEWLEVVAIRQGRRSHDRQLVDEIFDKELAAADALAAEGRGLEALWRLQTVSRTFAGLRDLSSIEKRIAMLSADRSVARERRERRSWDAWDKRYLQRLLTVYERIRDPTVVVGPRELNEALGIETLKRKARRPGYEGVTAQRVLERIWTQTSFYMTRDFFAQGNYARALTVLSVAVTIREDSQIAWYNLACAAARSGARKRALEALAKAVDVGFRDVDHMVSDPDLESLREDPGFRELLASLRSGNAPEG